MMKSVRAFLTACFMSAMLLTKVTDGNGKKLDSGAAFTIPEEGKTDYGGKGKKTL